MTGTRPAAVSDPDPTLRIAQPVSKRRQRPRLRRGIGSFQTAFAAYLGKGATLEHLRAAIRNCVADTREFAEVIGQSCSTAFEAGHLSRDSLRLLLTDVAELMSGNPQAAAGVEHAKPDSQSMTGRVLRHRFDIKERVATGGIGVLYRAIDQHRLAAGFAEAAVAIKLLSPAFRNCPDALRSLQCEARNARRLIHANIRTVYDLDRCSSDFFITMEWLYGESLANRLDRTGSLPMAGLAAGKILSGIAAGLGHAHAQGVVHGDVKPGNVFLTTDGQIKLLDFGESILLDSGTGMGALGQRAISPAYASCELHECSRPEISDDVFGLAVMAYRMLAGVRPFGRYSPIEAGPAPLRPHRPDGLSNRQWTVLQNGLAFRRAERPQNVTEFVAGLLQTATPVTVPKVTRHGSPLHVAA